MPIYNYRCLDCGKEIEIKCSIKESEKIKHHHEIEKGSMCLGIVKKLVTLFAKTPGRWR